LAGRGVESEDADLVEEGARDLDAEGVELP
jgi:hypothetical protein